MKKKATPAKKAKVVENFLRGEAFDFDDDLFTEEPFVVSQAIVTPTRIALDWDEGGDPYHGVAISHDGGTTYRGNYGFPKPLSHCRLEVMRFTARDGTELLHARWNDRETGRCGLMIVRLMPGTKQ